MKHCWHMSSYQHAVTNHKDETCCWCDESRCLKGKAVYEGHGKFNPEKRVTFVPVKAESSEEECKGRNSQEKS